MQRLLRLTKGIGAAVKAAALNWCPSGGDLEEGGLSLQNVKDWSPRLGLGTLVGPWVIALEMLGRGLEWREG